MTVINTNLGALRAQAGSKAAQTSLSMAMERLSTGKRINSAKDDAAGLAVAQRMTASVRAFTVAIRNANDGASMAQSAEGAMGEVTNMLQRMRELAVQSANGTIGTQDRAGLQSEMDQLMAEIDNISAKTSFNGIKLFDGSATAIKLQTGVNSGDTVGMSIASMSTRALGLQGFRVEGQLTTGRVGATIGVAADDVLINGQAALSGALSVSSGTDGTYAAVNAHVAASLAAAINGATSQHGVQATAYNSLTGSAVGASVFAAGDLVINGQSIAGAGSVEEFVANINRDAAGVTAALGSNGAITLSNDTGNNIVVAGTTPSKAGFVTGTYEGYVTLSNLTGGDISVTAKNAANGFPSGAGTLADVKSFGINQTTDGASFGGSAVSASALGVADDVRINGVRVGVSADASALAKAAAINLISGRSGVTATASTAVKLAVDLDNKPKDAVAQVYALDTSALTVASGKSLVFSDGTKTYQATQTGTAATDLASLVSAINGGSNAYTASLSGGDLLITANAAGTALSGSFRLDADAVKQVRTFDLTGAVTTAGDNIVLTVGANSVTAVADANTTLTATIDALVAAVNNDPNFNTDVVASRTGSSLVLTAKVAGTAFAGSYTLAAETAGSSAAVTGTATTANQQGVTVAADLPKAVANVADGTNLLSINGRTVDITDDDSLSAIVTRINGAGINGVAAAMDTDGNLVLTSSTGTDITVKDTSTTAFVTGLTSVVGDASTGTLNTTGLTVKGRITLSAADGGSIRIEDKSGAAVAKLGLAEQGGNADLVGGKLSIGSAANAGVALDAIDQALDTVLLNRGTLGAVQNRLAAAVNNLSSLSANTEAARSRIEDADFAAETTNLAKAQILSQAATAMLAQANQSQQEVLTLLRG